MQVLEKEVGKMKSRLNRLLKKETLSATELNMLKYASELISFRIKMVTEGSFPANKLLDKEKQLLSHLTEEEIKALNLSILYKNVKKKIPRDELDLKNLQRKINKKAP